MALYGVLGGIHGNREALAAALAALERRGARRVVCLGDLVGYNADPEECVQMARRCCAVTIAGHHDLIALGRLDFRRCSTESEYSLRRTRRELGAESRNWLAGLPPNHVLEDGVVLVHGGVRDVQQPMATPAQIRENAQFLREDFPAARLCFFGHGGEHKVYGVDGDDVQEISADGRPLQKNRLHFVNPGSVDASRKGGPRLAECALFDTLEWSVELLRLPYDSAAAEAKAAVFGYRIPPLTDRLYTLRRRIADRF
jgi:predicted phosphodiesterase